MRPATVGLATIGAAIAASLLICPAHAQQAPSPLVGERVRVTGLEGFRPLTGRVLEVGRDSLVLADDTGAPTPAIPLSRVERLELSLGTRRNVGKGAWIGALSGLAAGAVYGALLSSAVDDLFEPLGGQAEDKTAEDIAFGAVFGAAAGALVGVGIGAMTKSERWTDVPRQRWSLSVGAQEGVRVGLRVAIGREPPAPRTPRFAPGL